MRALIPAPWRTIFLLLFSAALVLGVIGGYTFGIPSVTGEKYFTIAEWWMYTATIAAIGVCVPRLRSIDLGCRRARMASLSQGLAVTFIALVCVSVGVVAINVRRAARAANYIGSSVPPGSEYILVGTLTAAGLAFISVTLWGQAIGTAVSLVALIGIASLHMLIPEGFPLPVPAQPYEGAWWEPISLAESLIVFLVGIMLWGRFGGSRASRLEKYR